MGQVSQQDEKAAAMSEALSWVRASLSWEQRLNELVADSPVSTRVDVEPPGSVPAVTRRRRGVAEAVPAFEA